MSGGETGDAMGHRDGKTLLDQRRPVDTLLSRCLAMLSREMYECPGCAVLAVEQLPKDRDEHRDDCSLIQLVDDLTLAVASAATPGSAAKALCVAVAALGAPLPEGQPRCTAQYAGKAECGNTLLRCTYAAGHEHAVAEHRFVDTDGMVTDTTWKLTPPLGVKPVDAPSEGLVSVVEVLAQLKLSLANTDRALAQTDRANAQVDELLELNKGLIKIGNTLEIRVQSLLREVNSD